MNNDLLNKALALCAEIEERQACLKDILASLAEEKFSEEKETQAVPVIVVEPEVTVEYEESADGEESKEVDTPADESGSACEFTEISEPERVEVPESVKPSAPETSSRPAGQDLRKAFTINDRFRFRRELFGGDDQAMVKVISRLSECSSYADAQAYLSSLGWSPDNDAAAEFKEIVSTFFNGYRI